MNRKEYPIRIARGHILLTDDRGTVLLVDTGSPLSFHSDGILSVGDESFGVPTSLMGVDSAYITDKVGGPVDGLVGMDIIGRGGLLVDVPGGRVVFGCPPEGMVRVPSRLGMGYMSLEMEVRGRTAKVIIDTGAPTSYVSESLTAGLLPVGTVEDFNPFVPGDVFETPLFEFPASIAGLPFTMSAGHLPQVMGSMLGLLGVDGVVGMELLRLRPLLIADGGVWVSDMRETPTGGERMAGPGGRYR